MANHQITLIIEELKREDRFRPLDFTQHYLLTRPNLDQTSTVSCCYQAIMWSNCHRLDTVLTIIDFRDIKADHSMGSPRGLISSNSSDLGLAQLIYLSRCTSECYTSHIDYFKKIKITTLIYKESLALVDHNIEQASKSVELVQNFGASHCQLAQCY